MWNFFTFKINFVDSTSLKWNYNQGNLARPLIHSEKDQFFCCVVFMLILGKEKKNIIWIWFVSDLLFSSRGFLVEKLIYLNTRTIKQSLQHQYVAIRFEFDFTLVCFNFQQIYSFFNKIFISFACKE